MWYIARDKDGTLTLFTAGKPFLLNRPYDTDLDDRDYTGCWLANVSRIDTPCRIEIDSSLFPEVTFECGPVQIDLIIHKE